jgi:hypothetical protein
MRKIGYGGWVITAGIFLAIAGSLWAYAPVHGLCPMHFRSVDSFHIKLTTAQDVSGDPWERAWAWAPQETITRARVVMIALLAYNVAGLMFLRRRRQKITPANQRVERYACPGGAREPHA